MFAGKESLDPKELVDCHSCRLGKWYDNVTDPRYTNHPAFQALAAPHKEVHEKGVLAAQNYRGGDVKGAFAAYAEVEVASQTVMELLRQLEELEA